MSPYYLDAIRKSEGFTPQASWDYKQHSIGYGTRARYPGEVIDRDEAERRFQAEIANARRLVDRFAPDLDEGSKAALTSLTFNAGDKWMQSGLGQAIRSGDMDTAKQLFVQYNKAGGEMLPGLASRREAEVAWFGGSPQAPQQPQTGPQAPVNYLAMVTGGAPQPPMSGAPGQPAGNMLQGVMMPRPFQMADNSAAGHNLLMRYLQRA